MSQDRSKKGPGRGLSQEIGQDADSALNANRPQRWTLGTIAGADYGVDYQVTVFDGEARAQHYFSLQLKGTTQAAARLADGEHLSHAFHRSTLHLWHSCGYLVFVAVADFIDDRDPKRAPVYFKFVSTDLDDLLSELPPTQASVTIRIPKANLLHRDLDIGPTLRPYVDELNDIRRQMRERRVARGDATPASPLQLSASADAALTSDLGQATDAIEAVIAQSSDAETLGAALAAIRAGDFPRALALTQQGSGVKTASLSKEAGIHAYLRARALYFAGENADVDRLLAQAQAALPNNDDVIAAIAQQKLDELPLGTAAQVARSDLLNELELHQGPNVATVVAKLHALQGDFEAARRVLAPLPASKSAITSLIVSIVEGDWKRAVSEAKRSRPLPTLTQPQSLIVNVLEARAHFQLAMGPMTWPEEGELLIPPAGLPGMDIAELRLAYELGLQAMQTAQALHWPLVTQHLLDVFPIAAMVLGRMEEAMPLLASMGLARASVPSVREAVGKLALNADRAGLLLQMRLKAADGPAYAQEDTLLAVAACRLGDMARAFAYITPENLTSAPDTDLYLSALVAIGVAADAAMRPELLAQIRARLQTSEAAQHFGAVLDTAVQVRQSLLNRSQALEQLRIYWQEHSRPPMVSRHLIMNCDPTETRGAELIDEVAADLLTRAALDEELQANVGQALITLGRFDDAVTLLRTACIQYASEPRLASLLAIALELNGESAEAFAMFERLIESDEATETARRYFINSAVRIGFIEKAESQVRNVLARSTDRPQRLRHLNTLFQLALVSSASPVSLWDLAWEYGRLASQDDEREEGIFLQEAMVALSLYAQEPDESRVVEYRDRMAAYLARFPESSYLRQIEIERGASGDLMSKALQAAMGVTDDDLRRAKASERAMDAGILPVPFSWRPKRYLRNVPDVFALWELRRRVPVDQRSWHFSSVMDDYDRGVPDDLVGWEPVLSLTSLLVLDELNLLETVLDAFERIVVARATLFALQNARNPVSAGYGGEKATRILDVLRQRFAKIIHPPMPARSPNNEVHAWHEEEQAAMMAANRLYFCDDILETYAVCEIDSDDGAALRRPSLSTLDFLDWADKRKRLISPQAVADHVAALVKLKIGVSVDVRYVVAAIPDALQLATSRLEAASALANAPALSAILGGIWAPDKPFPELTRHFAATLAYLATVGNASDAVLEAFWARWLGAVRLQIKPAGAPIQKLGCAFVVALNLVDDELAIGRLWHSYWAAIESGLLSGMERSADPDRAGVTAVANILGEMSSTASNLLAADLSLRARSALGAGTELDALYEITYVNAAAAAAQVKR